MDGKSERKRFPKEIRAHSRHEGAVARSASDRMTTINIENPLLTLNKTPFESWRMGPSVAVPRFGFGYLLLPPILGVKSVEKSGFPTSSIVIFGKNYSR